MEKDDGREEEEEEEERKEGRKVTEGKVRARERERRGGGAFAGSRGLAVEAGEQRDLRERGRKRMELTLGLKYYASQSQ